MDQIKSVSNRATGNDLRCRRLLFRSWHRGTQASDLILGPFAVIFLAGFDTSQLDRFEALLDCSDPEVFDWIICGSAPPPQHDHAVMRLLRNFCIPPSRDRAHNGN
jgi:antitoxin CptB